MTEDATMDNRARGKWIGNARAALFLMNGVSAQPLIEFSPRSIINGIQLPHEFKLYMDVMSRQLASNSSRE